MISTNTTGMPAGLTIVTDKEGREHCLVVVKGTFDADENGRMSLAVEQQSLVQVDEHYGAPESTAIRYESDFAPFKPQAEVLVVGKAIPPNGRPTRRLTVRLEIEGRTKEIEVVGDRRWERTAFGLRPSEPDLFIEMPLTFNRAFGGQDESRGPDRVAVEHRNLVGVGFNPHRSGAALLGRPLPNLEDPRRPIADVRDRPNPIGYGVIGRNWKQRSDFAGTYDQHWLDDVCPFLPADFDTHYFMSAPQDQWFPYFTGGEQIRCVHMAERAIVAYVLPAIEVKVQFRFADRTVLRMGQHDTVLVEPHLGRAMLTWRTSAPIGKKLTHLREVLVGDPPRREPDAPRGQASEKPRFPGLAAAVRWSRERRNSS